MSIAMVSIGFPTNDRMQDSLIGSRPGGDRHTSTADSKRGTVGEPRRVVDDLAGIAGLSASSVL